MLSENISENETSMQWCFPHVCTEAGEETEFWWTHIVDIKAKFPQAMFLWQS